VLYTATVHWVSDSTQRPLVTVSAHAQYTHIASSSLLFHTIIAHYTNNTAVQADSTTPDSTFNWHANMAYQNPYDDERTNAQYQDYNPYNPYTEPQNQPEVYGNNYPPLQRAPTSSRVPSVPGVPLRRESSGFEQGEFSPAAMPPASKWDVLPRPPLQFIYPSFLFKEADLWGLWKIIATAKATCALRYTYLCDCITWSHFSVTGRSSAMHW
jgi:hypothetical protein